MDYFIWEAERRPEYCILDRLPGGNKAMFRPRVGRLMGGDYEETLDFEMSPDLGGIGLADLVRNTLGFYVTSTTLKTVLEAESGAEFEFLPIRIVNRRGRPEPDAYWIANLVDRQVTCANLGASEMRESSMRKGRYTSLKRLQIDTDKIDPEFRIFRLQELPKLFIVRDDLKLAIEESATTGSLFHAMGDPVLID